MTVADMGEAEAEITAAEAEAAMADIRVEAKLEFFFWCINSLPMWYADMHLNPLLSFAMH